VAAEKVQIVGIGDDGVEGMTAQARRLVEAADVLVGPESCATLVPESLRGRLVAAASLEELVERIEAAGPKRVVVLASGDPLFYGTARYVCSKLGKDRFEVVPHVSSMQLAFARVKESWEDAFLANLSGQSIERVIDRVRSSETAGLFTSDQWPAPAVARALLDEGIDAFQAYVCENLGSPDERVTQGSLADIAKDSFASPNVMILVRKAKVADKPGQVGTRLFGNPDECFLQSRPKRGLLTPAEVRSLALAELQLTPASEVWDVGAGSGSVGLEAARIAREGRVHAIEMDPDDHALIRENAARFGVMNLNPVLGRAPEAWASLPDLRRRQRPRRGDARGAGLAAAQARRPARDRLQQHREPRGGALAAPLAVERRRLLDGEHRAGHRAARPDSVRGDQPDLPDRRHEARVINR
jgi:precorrin-6Y C5,15-methyltransferase (decarboxylating)